MEESMSGRWTIFGPVAIFASWVVISTHTEGWDFKLEYTQLKYIEDLLTQSSGNDLSDDNWKCKFEEGKAERVQSLQERQENKSYRQGQKK